MPDERKRRDSDSDSDSGGRKKKKKSSRKQDYSDSESRERDRKEKKEKKSKKERRSDSDSPPRRKKEKRSRRDSRSRDRRRDRSRDRRDDSRDRGRGGYDDRRRDDRGAAPPLAGGEARPLPRPFSPAWSPAGDRGRGGYDEDFSRSVAGRYPGRMRHEMMRADGDTARVDEEKVNIILSQRIEAKRNKDFFTSDRLRDQLRQQFGVEVMDRECKWWSMRGGQGPAINVDYGRHDYARTDDLPGVDVEEIDKLLSQRLHARRTHDYFHADNLRSQLNRMGVEAQKPGLEDYNGRRDDDEPRGGGRRRGDSPEGGDSAEGGDSPERVDGGKGAAGESEE